MIYWRLYDFNNIKPKKVKHKREFYDDNIYCFDIETSSAYVKNNRLIHPTQYHKRKKDETPVSICWIWQMCLNGVTVYGRTLEEFAIFVQNLNDYLGVKPIIYVHNLSFEFMFASNVFNWTKVFARAPHRVIYCECSFAQFRCSYMLTRLSLKNWGKQTGGTQKADGDLDYSTWRTPYSRVNPIELGYCENDVVVMYEGLQVYKKRYVHVCNIPITQTGEVRKKVKEMFKDDTKHLFNMTRLLPENEEMYNIYKSLVWGGITHANVYNANKVYRNVRSFDITSSYPFVMCAYKYPIAPPIKWNVNEWEKYMNIDTYCAFYRVRFTGLKSRLHNHYLSGYKYISKEKAVLDNGRIIKAASLDLWITDVDLKETLDSYTYEHMDVQEMYIAKSGYMPKKLIEFILVLFENKCTLDGKEGFEDIYLQSKQFINALFGMELTDLIQTNIIYKSGEWYKEQPDINKVLEEKRIKWYNNFNSYLQGIFVIAYARRALWTMVKLIDRDVIYYDTDSVKYIGNYDWAFKNYNAKVKQDIEKMLQYYDITRKYYHYNKKGELKTLGEFKDEGTYKEFKTLGAKRYAYRDHKGILHMTVAGVNKEHGVKYLKDNINNFCENMELDFEYCQRLQLFYNPDMPPVIWNKGKYDEYKCTHTSGICMSNSRYKMSMQQEFLDLINICVKGIY